MTAYDEMLSCEIAAAECTEGESRLNYVAMPSAAAEAHRPPPIGGNSFACWSLLGSAPGIRTYQGAAGMGKARTKREERSEPGRGGALPLTTGVARAPLPRRARADSRSPDACRRENLESHQATRHAGSAGAPLMTSIEAQADLGILAGWLKLVFKGLCGLHMEIMT